MMILRASIGLLLGFLVSACNQDAATVSAGSLSGDRLLGKALLSDYGCAACHRIRGIGPWQGLVGPPLEDIAKASYIAGLLPNTEENMVRWIMHPRQISPQTVMPDLGVDARQARDMASYLYRQ